MELKKKDKNGFLRNPGILSKNSNKGTSRRLKLYTDDDYDTKTTMESLQDKVIDLSKDKIWRSYEIIYYMAITPVSKKSTHIKKHHTDHYLFIFYNSQIASAYIVSISNRGKHMEIKQSWNMSDIRNLKLGNDLNTFIWSTEIDYTWKAASSVERDEVVWVLIHVCKYLCDNDAKFQAIDIQGLGTAIVTNDTLTKHPPLAKYLEDNLEEINRQTSQNDVLAFTPEEVDAEKLFDELHWGMVGSDGSADPAHLQRTLKNEADSLHVEICDFLLQWEDDEVTKDGSTTSGARETLELLSVLDSVDQELRCVDEWLGAQVGYLSGVQAELFQIEAENGALETSWHNLSAVKTMITDLLVGPLALASEHEKLLRDPGPVVQASLADSRDLRDSADILLPLVTALGSLRDGLEAIKGTNTAFDKAQWQKLQSMSVVSHQRHKLVELTEHVCHGLFDFCSTLFKGILQHRALSEAPGKGQAHGSRTVIVRKFSFSSLTNSVKEQQGRYLVASEGNEVGAGVNTNDIHFSDLSTNQLLAAQQSYHSSVTPFVPLLVHLSALSPSLAETIRSTYVESTESHLYGPLFKEMFRNLFASIPHRQGPVFTLGTAPRSLARKHTNPSLRFQHPSLCRAGGVLVASPWTVLAVALTIAEDVVAKEKVFLQRVILPIHNDRAASDYGQVSMILTKLFEYFRDKMMKLVTGNDYADGIEVVAMQVTISMLVDRHQQHSSVVSSSEESSFDLIESLLFNARATLQDRLQEFCTAQIAWIRQSKEDPKKTSVLMPFLRFPAFVDQMKEFSGDKRFECVDDILSKVGKELLSWLHDVASQNEKYFNIVMIHNLEFLVESLSVRGEVKALERVAQQAAEQKAEAERRYVEWMVSYEFPVFAGLADRVKELGRRATTEEMGLYIRREEVSRAVSKMDRKTIESSIMVARKRLDKHFSGFLDASGLNVVPRLWKLIQTEVCKMFNVIDRVAKMSYQLNLIVDEDTVKTICDKAA
mmetsp:Transcript_16821/g.25292  ORF Transcript_16821/g.25292 Transcript_16821/m.25292 type:complete len:994 (+) Transcript_16821:71-3052(+)